MINIAKGAKRKIEDYHLSRYACYLIAQNGDVRKKVIAAAQAYFVVKTRTLELFEESNKKLSEEEKRLIERRKVRSEELVDNWFRIIHTEAKLKREKIDNQYDANATHYNVGREIRKIIKKFGNDMPEDLPTPKISIKEIEKCIKNKE